MNRKKISLVYLELVLEKVLKKRLLLFTRTVQVKTELILQEHCVWEIPFSLLHFLR